MTPSSKLTKKYLNDAFKRLVLEGGGKLDTWRDRLPPHEKLKVLKRSIRKAFKGRKPEVLKRWLEGL